MNLIDRRLFLNYLTILGAFLAGLLSFPLKLYGVVTGRSSDSKSVKKIPLRKRSGEKSRVVLVKNSVVFNKDHEVDFSIACEMVSKGMLQLTGESTIEHAWRSLFNPTDVVGIKVNCLGGREIATHPELVNAVVSGLTRAGIAEENIVIWDRLTKELESSGYSINTSHKGVRCFGTDSDYDPYPEIAGSIGSCFSAIVSSLCTALINIPVLKDHDLSGVSLSLKNFYGAIHNPNKYHDNHCDPYIADLNTHPYLRDKLRLIICDALTMQYQGGPAYKPQWALEYHSVLFSQDPVAVDCIGTRLIEEKRKEKGLSSLKAAGREPVHITTAAKKGLGIGDHDKIELLIV